MIKRKIHILFYIILAAFVFISAAFITGHSGVQYNLKVVLTVHGDAHQDDPVYISGNFNNWLPGKEQYQCKKINGVYQVDIKGLLEDVYEFKFTRGSWSSVAATKAGADVGNTIIKLRSDTTIYCTVEAWKDDFDHPEKVHTASENVFIVNNVFYIPQLNTHKRVSVYLPPNYAKSKTRYPVLYLQDGQNIFDDFTASFGEWKVDEILDSMIKKGRKPAIVVAVENGPERLQEYNPFDFEKFGEGKGDEYVDFLIETLKPYIDSTFRTMPDKKNTIIAGSSMGGLISYYAMLKHPDIFGKAGVFSPAFWTAEAIKPMTDSLGSKVKGKLFFYIGEQEGKKYMDDMLDVVERLGKRSSTMIYTAVDPDGIHNEAAWSKWFGEFYNWITADGYNYIIKTKD